MRLRTTALPEGPSPGVVERTSLAGLNFFQRELCGPGSKNSALAAPGLPHHSSPRASREWGTGGCTGHAAGWGAGLCWGGLGLGLWWLKHKAVKVWGGHPLPDCWPPSPHGIPRGTLMLPRPVHHRGCSAVFGDQRRSRSRHEDLLSDSDPGIFTFLSLR